MAGIAYTGPCSVCGKKGLHFRTRREGGFIVWYRVCLEHWRSHERTC